MIHNSLNKRAVSLSEDFSGLKSEICAIIAKGREREIEPESLVDDIMSRVLLDTDIVIEESVRTERPLNMQDLLLIARKAVGQAAFDGASIVLPSGERIKKRTKYRLEC